jgi:hypothetical protein
MFSWNISALRITFWSLIFNCLAIISLPGPGPEPMFFYADAFLQGHEFCRLYLQELRNSEWSWTSRNRSDIFPCLLTCSNCVLCKKVVWTRFLAQYIIHAISFYGSAAELKKKSNKPKRPTIKSLFGNFFRVLVLWRYWGRPCHYIFMLRTLTSVQSILKAMTSLKEVSQANCRHS